MIRWCSYCQRLLGEAAPLTDYSVTHGICVSCEAAMADGAPLLAEHGTLIAFYRELFGAAAAGDRSTCAALAARAAAAGLSRPEVMIGLLQPALAEIGERWERGLVTVDDERRFTDWCAALLGDLEEPSEGPLDLLIVLAPGNRHDLGARVAAQVLSSRGIRTATAGPRGTAELHALLEAHRPAFLGYSCALPSMVAAARGQFAEVVALGFRGELLIGGAAVRRAPAAATPELPACATLDDAVARVRRQVPGALAS